MNDNKAIERKGDLSCGSSEGHTATRCEWTYTRTESGEQVASINHPQVDRPFRFRSALLANLEHTGCHVQGLYVKDLANELMDCLKQYDFALNCTTRTRIAATPRGRAAVEELAGWSQVILASACGISRPAGIDEISDSACLSSPYRHVDELLMLYELWFEPWENRSYYVDYDGALGLRQGLRATIGNVAAAMGLAILDRLVVRLYEVEVFEALAYHEAAWGFARVARYHDTGLTNAYFSGWDPRLENVESACMETRAALTAPH